MAARSLLAYQRGDETEEALIGALLMAEGLDHQRMVAEFCAGMAKGMSRKGPQ